MSKKTVLDSRDRQILEVLQDDAMTPITAIAERVGLSTTPCWRRIQRLERDGVIRRRVALLDAASLNVPVSVFVAVRTNRHSAAWVAQFRRTLDAIPEIVEAYRMSGEIDYLLRVVVPDIRPGLQAVDRQDRVCRRDVELFHGGTEAHDRAAAELRLIPRSQRPCAIKTARDARAPPGRSDMEP